MASGADRTWYGATVTGVGADMTYSLRYDDGGQATGVGADHVRAPPAQKRQRACVPFCHPGPGDGDDGAIAADRLDTHLRAIADGGASDRLLALGCAELYTRKRQRGEGQDLELAREGLLALARHKRARAGQ